MRRTARLALILALLVPAACANHAKHSIALYESGDYAGASRAADEGLASHPDDNALWAMKVRSAIALGDADAAAKAYDQYVAKRGGNDKDLLSDLTTATLSQALASPSVKMKVAAIEAIERIEIHALTDAVAQAMNDDDDRVAAAAAVALLRSGIPDAPRVADDTLHSTDAEARRMTLDGVSRKAGTLALADIQAAVKDPDPRVRRTAVRWLGTLKDRDSVELLTRHMRDPDDSVRAASASALARIGVGDLRGLAKQAIADRSLAVRLAGVELLAAAKADAELVALTDDADAMIALQAAIAVKTTHAELAGKALARAVAAPEWTIRAGAANLMTSAVDKASALGFAQKLAADGEVGVRIAAARVLSRSGDAETAKRVLVAALDNADYGVQAAADLADLGDPAGTKALSAFVRDTKRTPAQRAAAAAAHRSAHRVTGGLVGALADSDGLVRVEAAAALGMLAK